MPESLASSYQLEADTKTMVKNEHFKNTKNGLQCYSYGGKIILFSRLKKYYSKCGLGELIRFKLHTKI
jgi:peptide methionine sulfoxide reductase MsrB